MKCYNVLMLAVVVTLLNTVGIAEEPKYKTKITALKEDLLPKKDWKNAGFEDVQATTQTFLWATREGDVETVLKCFDNDLERKLTDSDTARMKQAADAATGYQPLAIRTINKDRVELKFKVAGWQEEPFVQQFKRVGKRWRIDSSSSTTTAEW